MVNNKILYDSCKTFNIDASSVQSLIESGANPLYEYDGETPLKAYVTKKNNNIKNDVVILLLSSVDYKNINDFDIFEYLCSDNIDINLLKLLISKGIEINSIKNGINIVEKYATTSNPNVDVFKLLLDKGIPTCSNIQYGYKIKIEQIRRAGEYYNWDDELDDYDYDYTTDYDDRMGKTVLYYYIITRSQDGYATSLDVINYLISHEKEMRYYTYREHTTLYYYLDKCDIKREIFDALFDSNYSGHELMNILSNYLRKQFRKKNHKIDNYIVDQLLFDRDTFYILELCNSLRNNILISTILKRYTDSIQDLLLEYVSYHTVYINVIKCMIDEGATLYRFKHINKYFQKFGNRDPKVVEYILKNGNLVVDNDNDDNLINIMPLFPTFSMRELDVLSILKLCKPYIDDINKIDKHGCSILYHCIESHSVSLVELLIDNGTDINIITKYGFTCITICVILADKYIPEIAELYIKILEIILSKLPTIECIKKTVDYLDDHRYLFIGGNNKSLLKICIKYFILVDYKYTCSMYPSYIEFITDCEKEIADMRQIKINGTDMLTVMYMLNKPTKKRYVNNPIFTDWANKQYKFYNQIIYNANKLIEQSKKINDMIEEVSIDDNRLSTLPLELRHLIFSYAFL
ncbi:ankyrin-like protein [Vaccinia virus]|uniref:Ankyrin-like protein n=1 Tax=Vaccinia virus TaxID=10245 RepID=A0A0A7A5J2_VACCV|nr:ankyrin-like protein [Vaccinia virus]QQA05728.1 truncated ankyrin-like protein [Vaccinia virus]WGO01650.1 truncated ankyrin-like protein [Vaccinia virus]WGO01878.1 ankyrin-like protein [Vaccinia virus]WGO02106.1 truncated ankyrin-like protein [Vaccinia virus]